jgi:predicted DNA-binding transcriptional regulator YafY
MPQNKGFALRIELLDECLRNRLRKWTLQDLIDKVSEKLNELYGTSASKRTIQDDLKYLRDEKGAPVTRIKDGSKTYFSYSDPNFSIKNLPIKAEEIGYLIDAINILKQVSDFKILNDVDEIVNKLQNTVSTNEVGSASIIQFERHTTAIGTEYIDDIFTAIKEKTVLRISYQPFNATDPKEYIFHPYLLKEYRNRWFVIGRKSNTDSITNFALDRIKGLKNSKDEYISNNLFNVETYFNNLIGVTFPENAIPEIVEIKVAPKQVPYIKTKPIHHTQQVIREYKDGSLLITLSLICNYELRAVLLSFGNDMKVNKPLFLRDEIKEILGLAIKNYNE